MQFPTKIPTVVGLLLIASIVGTLVFFFERIARIPSQASGTEVPKNVGATNVADSSFTFLWTTGSPATGAISISTQGGFGSQVVFDDRDSSGRQNTYPTHSVTFRNAKPATDYAVKILSNGKTFLDNDKPYTVRTGPSLSTPTNGLGPAYGTITTNDGLPASGALVVLTLDGAQTLSTLVTKTGTWLIPLNLARTAGFDAYIAASERIGESIKVFYTGSETFALTDTLNDAPVPVMIIGKTYDFRRQQAKSETNAIAQAAPTPQVLGAETTSLPNKNYTIAITSPAQGSGLATNVPFVAGTGFPGKIVSVVLGITSPISGSTTVGTDGMWQFTPPKPLSEGKQSVTITTANSLGKATALTNTFTVLKSGTQVLGDATPSAIATPTATPIATSSSLSAQPIPRSGTSLPTIILILLGLGLLASGTVIFTK